MPYLGTQEKFDLVTLIPNVVDISFRHRKEISQKFNDIIGLYGIDHISIDIVDTSNQLLYFSTTPSMGYNLISSNLWQYDGSISPTYFETYPFYYWDQTYHQKYFRNIKKIKENEYGFNFGFTLVRKVAGFHILYSFATRDKDPNRKIFFQYNLEKLIKIGDFCYKSIRELYSIYCGNEAPPILLATNAIDGGSPIKYLFNKKPTLRLVVDNTR